MLRGTFRAPRAEKSPRPGGGLSGHRWSRNSYARVLRRSLFSTGAPAHRVVLEAGLAHHVAMEAVAAVEERRRRIDSITAPLSASVLHENVRDDLGLARFRCGPL